MRYDYSLPRASLIARILDLHEHYSAESDFSFSVPSGCPENDQLPWFRAHGKGERPVYRIADALFPFSSREKTANI